MRMFVKIEAYDSVIAQEDIRRARAVVGEKIQAVMATGKVRSSGVFGDMRGGYFDLDIDTAEEFNELVGDLVDFARIETHPVASFESLAELFEKSPPR